LDIIQSNKTTIQINSEQTHSDSKKQSTRIKTANYIIAGH